MSITETRRQPGSNPGNAASSILTTYLQQIRRFSPNARLFLLGTFLMGLTFEMFQLLMPLFLREQGMNEGEIGVVLSGRASGMALMAFPAAWLLSKLPLKPFLLCSSLGFALFTGLSVWQQDLTALFTCTFCMGVCFTFFRVSGGPFFMQNSSGEERTYLFACSYGLLVLAGLVGSVGAGRLVVLLGEQLSSSADGYHVVLMIGAAMALAAFLPFALIRQSSGQTERPRQLHFALLRERLPLYARILWCHGLIGIGAGLIIPFLPLYFRDQFDQPTDMIGLFQGVVAASMFIGAVTGPLLSRRFGLVRSIVLSQLASIPFMVALAFTDWLPLAVVAFVIRGALMNMVVPLGNNFAMEYCRKDEQGLVNAIIMLAWTGSWMLSTRIGGEVIEAHGYRPTLLLAAALYCIASLSYYVFFRHAERRTEGASGWVLAEGDAV